jgi:predicted ArsR family transcriptional regulator
LSATGSRTLEILQESPDARDVQDLAHLLQLHPNSVRQVLDDLVARGLVHRERRAAEGRGRPAWLYRADPDRREPDRRVQEHSALARVLAARISATNADAESEGRAAGEMWGAALAEGRTGNPRATMVEVLKGLDFSPRADRQRRRILLRTCPLLDVAREYPEVVCAVHAGLVDGFLQTMGDPHDVTLEPFAAADGCVLRLQRARENL